MENCIYLNEVNLVSNVECACIGIITPTFAKYLLENCNEHNRNINSGTISSYTSQMKQGLWELNGEPIIFDRNGKLLNGQHRLTACVNSKIPFRTFVSLGVKPSAFTSIDQGNVRTFKDVMSIEIDNFNIDVKLRKKYISVVSKMVKQSMAINESRPTEHGMCSTRNVPNNEMRLRFYYANKNHIDLLFVHSVNWFASSVFKTKIFQHKDYFSGMALTLLMNGVPFEKISEFMTTLFGSNYGSNDATYNLREYLSSHIQTKFKPLEIWNMYALAWNAFYTNKPLRLDKRNFSKDKMSISLICE